jgi:hypothetical protein
MPVWNRIVEILQPQAEHRKQADALVQEYRQRGCLPHTPKELLSLADEVIAAFYTILLEGRVPVSPVADQPDSGWITQASACFVNVRATGVHEGQFGTFLQASKLLPGLRVKALHLAPFLEYEFGTVYAIRSLKTIAPQLLHPALLEGGLRAPLQLDAFIQAAHVLGKAVGFDLEPHTAQYSIPALEVPEAFRWIKVFPQDRNWLDAMMQPDTVYAQEVQDRLVAEVRTLITGFLRARSLHTFDEEENDSAETLAQKRQGFQDAVQLMIREGYWTVPAHAWDSEGLPRFAGYHSDGYPLFQYMNRQGNDSGEHAIHIVTPFAFYHHIPLQGTSMRQKPEPNPAAVDLFCSAFLHWRDRHHFDFVRHDSVDHVFDSVFDGDGNWPLSDRPTPAVLSEFIRRSKLPGKPFIAHLAERLGNEAEDYSAIGYDLLLGSDMMETVGQAHLDKSFRLQGQLEDLNSRRKSPFAVAYAVDTHDTGNPFFWGQSLTEKLGAEGMKVRLFLSRFLGWGRGKRPKYEVMGLADLSNGLFPANVSEKNMVWVGDLAFNAWYHRLEDLYGELKPALERGKVVETFAGRTYAWWMVDGGSVLMVFAVWYDDAWAFSETGVEHSDAKERYMARPGEFPFAQRDLPSKAGNQWNLRALRTEEFSPSLKLWVIPAKA